LASPSAPVPCWRTIFSWLKSTLPRSIPIGGMMMSLTSELTTAPMATPMMTPTARAKAFVLSMNDLNSEIIRSGYLVG